MLEAGHLATDRASRFGQLHGQLQRSVQSAPLIGRQAELAEVAGLLANSAVRMVTLTGRSGVGKTRLALEAAWALDTARPGSACLVSLASLDTPDLLLAEIAAQLEIPAQPGASVADAVVRWFRHSARVLLLDNFEHLLGASVLLSDLLDACDELQLLVTSQSPLRLAAERVVPLLPLALPQLAADAATVLGQPAVALYCDRARAANGHFRLDEGNIAAVVSLCRELEGLPLAIELAAARAMTFPAGELMSRLARQRLDVLRSARPDAPARHRDMRAAIGWTYSLMTAFERRLLRRLAVAGGAFDIDDAEVLGDGDPVEALDALSSLVDFHLISPVDADGLARFEAAPSIRDFASEELASSGEAAEIQDRWITWLARRARVAATGLDGPTSDAEWAWLESSHDCLRNALHTCLDSRRADAALDIASGLAPLWHARASDSAHARLMNRAIDLADDRGIQTAALAEVLLWSGVIGIRVLDADRADHYLELLKRGEEQARALADDRLIMLAAHCRVTTTVMTRDIERGVRATEEGLDIAMRRGEACWISRFEVVAARWAESAGELDKAVTLALAALANARRSADTRAVLNAALMLQTLAPSSPTAAAALPPPRELLAMTRATHQRLSEALLLPVLALQALPAGDLAGAADWCAAALEISGFDPTSYAAGFALLAAVQIASRHGDHELAARIHGSLQDIRSRLHAAMPPSFLSAHIAVEDGMRVSLGAEAFDVAVAAGAGTSWDSIVTEVSDYLRALAQPATVEADRADADHEAWAAYPGLTDRQLQVVQLMVAGLTNKEIARRLGVTPKTVMHHTVAIYQRLGVRGRSEAVAWAIRAGVTPDPRLLRRHASELGRRVTTPGHDTPLCPAPRAAGAEFGRAGCGATGL